MARRLVRHQAALIVAALAIAACSKKSCACLASYAPESAAADIDPLVVYLWAPTKENRARLTFPIGTGAKTEACPRLPDGTKIVLNGAAGTVDTLGGSKATGIGQTACKGAEASWLDLNTLDSQASAKLVIDDGTTKLDVTIPLGAPLRLTPPSARPTGDSVTLVGELDAGGGTVTVHEAYAVQSQGAMSTAADTKVDGKRITFTLPARAVTESAHSLKVDFTIATTPVVVPPRRTTPKAYVHYVVTLPFTVTR